MGRRLQSLASALTGAVAAAGVMYYLDAGARRHAGLGEGSSGAARRGLSRLQGASRDLVHRAYGLGARATALLRGSRVAPPVLVERVRSRLGRVVSHPGAVHVSVDEARIVRLSGAVLAWESEPLRRAVATLSGVEGIRDELQVHESAEHVSALQGSSRHLSREGVRESLPDNPGSTALRLLMALAGSSLLLGGSRRRGTLGAVGAAAGGALLLRSVAMPRHRAPRYRAHALEICRTLHVHSPVEKVWAALRQCDRLVGLLPPLRALRHRADGATQWSVTDPQGWRLDWTAVITELQPNRQIAWRTTPDSELSQWGMVWLEPIDAQQTRLHLYVSCRTVPGRTAQALRRLAGSSPQGELTENLSRLRQYLEMPGGTPPAASASASTDRATRDALEAWTQPMTGRTH